MPREYTNKLYNMLEEGLLLHEVVITACLNYMSEDDVKDMMECNEFITESDDSEEVEK